jgi:predicted O-methyltransferase YrrM
MATYVQRSEDIAGWARGEEAVELCLVARRLPADAVIVEIGTFLGSSAVLFAGARKTAGSGVVHCVDPFDGSGDAHSIPYYEELLVTLERPLRVQFDDNIERAGLADWVVGHEGTAEQVARGWTQPIDLLFLDGDQSPAGARSAYEAWSPFLKPSGTLAVHNSADRTYAPDHDGHRRVVVEEVRPPRYLDVRCVGTTTFARRAR